MERHLNLKKRLQRYVILEKFFIAYGEDKGADGDDKGADGEEKEADGEEKGPAGDDKEAGEEEKKDGVEGSEAGMMPKLLRPERVMSKSKYLKTPFRAGLGITENNKKSVGEQVAKPVLEQVGEKRKVAKDANKKTKKSKK